MGRPTLRTIGLSLALIVTSISTFMLGVLYAAPAARERWGRGAETIVFIASTLSMWFILWVLVLSGWRIDKDGQVVRKLKIAETLEGKKPDT
jgi:hypothetical protein